MIDPTIEPGTYVVAVSGGVDSVALLHALQDQPNLKLIVAHYDHGIRHDSHLDRQHVQSLAKNYGLPFVYDSGNLGPLASEDRARKARYDFLHKVRRASGSKAVITAHHKDDSLETAILHLIRGTGRRGLGSLRSTDIIKRPVLNSTKEEIVKYALDNQLTWREDPSNQSTNYLRNHVRHNIIPRLSDAQKQRLHELIASTRQINQEVDNMLDLQLHLQPKFDQLDKKWFVSLPHSVACEVLAHWLRRLDQRSFDKKMLEKLVIGAKTLGTGKTININKEYNLRVKPKVLALQRIER